MKVVSVLILLFLSTISFAQKTGAGYFGKHHFLNLELSPMLRLYETGHKQNNYSFSHDWQTRSKIGIEFGHQNKNNSQWRIGLSNYEIPLAVLNSERSTDVSNGVTKSTTSLFRAFGNNIQFGLAGKNYVKGLAPSGLYVGIKVGMSLSFYNYQLIDTVTIRDYNYNTLDQTIQIFEPRKTVFQNPFLCLNIGRTFMLGTSSTFDLGLRTSHFFGSRNSYFTSEMVSESSFSRNLYRMNVQVLNSTHTFELYAAFSFHF